MKVGDLIKTHKGYLALVLGTYEIAGEKHLELYFPNLKMKYFNAYYADKAELVSSYGDKHDT